MGVLDLTLVGWLLFRDPVGYLAAPQPFHCLSAAARALHAHRYIMSTHGCERVITCQSRSLLLPCGFCTSLGGAIVRTAHHGTHGACSCCFYGDDKQLAPKETKSWTINL